MKYTPKKVTRNEQVNLVDIILYLLSNWGWFVLCVIVAVGFAYARYARMPLMYQSRITAIMKNPASSIRTASLETYDRMVNRINMTEEDLQLRSMSLMNRTVAALDADVHYSKRIKARDVELYQTGSPVVMRFDRKHADPGLLDLSVTPLEDGIIQIDGADGPMVAAVGDTVALGRGQVVFEATPHYDEYIGTAVSIRKVPVASAAAGFLSRLEVEHEGNIISLVEEDFNAQRAADILNMLIIKYNEEALREKRRVAVQTSEFIEERLKVIEQELGGVQGELVSFQKSNQLMSVTEAAANYLSDSRGYSAQIVGVETRIALANYVKNYIEESSDRFQMIPVNTGLNDANIDGVIAQYNDLILKREKLVEASSTESPAVKASEMELSTLQHNISGLLDNLISSLQITRQDLDRREGDAVAKFSEMPGKQQQMLEILRQQSIKESLYTFLLNKREENALSRAMADDNIQVVDPAAVSYAPVSPNRLRMMVLALLIGLLVPAAVLIARLFLDSKIRTRKEIEENVDVPFLAEIPLSDEMRRVIRKIAHHRKGTQEPSPFVYDPAANSLFTEAMRMLCTNLVFLDPDNEPPLVVSMTSYTPNSGKTFITANMALCLADARKKVVVVDADMRKRALSGVFKLKHKVTGLSNYLYDKNVSIDEIIHKDVKPGVDFVPAGPTPPNPGELLARPRFDEFIQQLRSRYEYILLDTVPVQQLADSMIINRAVETNIFILRSGQLDRRILPRIDELSKKQILSNMAIVFNGPKVRRRSGYGFGLYGYGYGYVYDNGNDYFSDKTQSGRKRRWFNLPDWLRKK